MVLLFDRNNIKDNIYDEIFATEQQSIVARELVRYIAANKNELTKTDMSIFATKLHDVEYETTMAQGQFKGKKAKLSYNKRQFYDRILTPMRSMGLIDYYLYKKTYKLSTKFSNDLLRIGLLWKETLRREGAKVEGV